MYQLRIEHVCNGKGKYRGCEPKARPAILAPDKPLNILLLKELHFSLYQLPFALIPQAVVDSFGLASSDMGFIMENNLSVRGK